MISDSSRGQRYALTPDVANNVKTDNAIDFNFGKNKQNPMVQNLIEKQKKHLREEFDKSQKQNQIIAK